MAQVKQLVSGELGIPEYFHQSQCPFISPAAFHQKASQGEEPASCVQGDSKLSWGHSGQRGLLLTSLASGSLSRWVPPEQPQDAGPVA